MREAILDYLNSLATGSFSVTSDLPWTSSGSPLYMTNPKRIYVDRPQVTHDPLIRTLDGTSINTEVTSILIYFTADAKQLPANYETLVSNIKLARNISTISGVSRRESDVTSEFNNDMLVTQIELRFTKLT
jgi:hypothetical protein